MLSYLASATRRSVSARRCVGFCVGAVTRWPSRQHAPRLRLRGLPRGHRLATALPAWARAGALSAERQPAALRGL